MEEKDLIDPDLIYSYTEDGFSDIEEAVQPETAINAPFTDSPLYPRLYIGNSAEHLNGFVNEPAYIDDNTTRTWTGLLTNIYG